MFSRHVNNQRQPSVPPRDPRSGPGVLATHHGVERGMEMQPMHGGVEYIETATPPVGQYAEYYEENSSCCSRLSVFWLIVAIATGILVVAAAALAIVVALNYTTTGEAAVVDALTLGMNLQREAFRGMRISQLCIAQKQIQCAADGLDPTACGATALELDDLCPLPPTLLQLLSESNVASALTESNTDAESQFSSQQSELY